MKKILITGGSGTVGTSLIDQYQGKYKFYSYSRNEKMQVSLKRQFPDTEIILGSVDDSLTLHTSISKIKPDVIIHAAALKHIDSAEISPIQAVKSNIIGSLNVIDSAVAESVPITVAISTDKACCADSNYGYTKALMEKMFLEAHTLQTKFAVCRFGNVSHSHGSVIPFWLGLHSENKPLPLTHESMNRLMFSREEAAKLVHEAVVKLESDDESFVLSQKMKTVNMLKLAKLISKNIENVGLRPGEKLNETLINSKEVPFTFVDGDYITIREYENTGENLLNGEYSSKNAEFMTKEEMLLTIAEADKNLKSSLLKSKIY
jgi:UDP-N-acetylglucosamine 4,6-dehydratase/5-epimerase